MKKIYAITADFRYRSDEEDWKKDKIFCIGICKTADEAVAKGNKALDYIERRIGNKFKERFSLNGSCFGSRNFLVADMNVKCKGKRMEIFVKITEYAKRNMRDVLTEVKNNLK